MEKRPNAKYSYRATKPQIKITASSDAAVTQHTVGSGMRGAVLSSG